MSTPFRETDIKEILDHLMVKSYSIASSNISANSDRPQSEKIYPENWEQLILWVLETCEVQKISKKAEQTAISYIDCFLSNKPVNQGNILELIGYICISVALKFEESREIKPSHIRLFCEDKFDADSITTTELYLLQVLNWNLDRPTPSEILSCLFQFTCEEFESEKICALADSFSSFGLADYEISRNSTLVIAVASALCAMEKLNYNNFCHEWLKVLQEKLRIDSSVVSKVANEINKKVIHLSMNRKE
jgi:Cyclin, N-terminal domain